MGIFSRSLYVGKRTVYFTSFTISGLCTLEQHRKTHLSFPGQQLAVRISQQLLIASWAWPDAPCIQRLSADVRKVRSKTLDVTLEYSLSKAILPGPRPS